MTSFHLLAALPVSVFLKGIDGFGGGQTTSRPLLRALDALAMRLDWTEPMETLISPSAAWKGWGH